MAPSKRQRVGNAILPDGGIRISNDRNATLGDDREPRTEQCSPWPSSLLCFNSRNGLVLFVAALLFLRLQQWILVGIADVASESSVFADHSQEAHAFLPLLSKKRVSHGDDGLDPAESRTRPIRNRTKIEQIENYKKGNGLMLNIHATHHGGTTFCGIIGRSGGPVASQKEEIAPSFACWFDQNGTVPEAKKSYYTTLNKETFLSRTPWAYDETDSFLHSLRPYFHMISWEYMGVDDMQRNLSETNWEHPELLSVIITRDPISRLLAGNRNMKLNYPGYNTGNLSHAGWWDIAFNPNRRLADNFFFRIVEGTKRDKSAGRSAVGNGTPQNNTTAVADDSATTSESTSQRRLKTAKKQRHREQQKENNDHRPDQNGLFYMFTDDNLPSALPPLYSNLDRTNYDRAVSVLNRFTVVLDIECLNEGILALANLVGLDPETVQAAVLQNDLHRKKRKKHDTKHKPARDRIGYQDVYEYLLEKNKWDIKLYEYSKTVSLVRCE
ncbi:unnamed protein product [Pseudo-nitzschia multistriata]|uniref:Sulfotransferase domain-containing protein n=1 Tax=Pseudo-nitzschia multistriata TaxID=183589 RepID=A0A448YY65_9STRA|nr:unnamed protein product [Pseudo-nitzschia multistriata]